VVIDEDVLLKAVVRDIKAEKAAHAGNVRVELGEIADDGGYFDVWVVADDLAELESLGKLKLAPAFAWGGSKSTPKALIQYELPSEQ
jgi:hypothetical protein